MSRIVSNAILQVKPESAPVRRDFLGCLNNICPTHQRTSAPGRGRLTRDADRGTVPAARKVTEK